MSNPTEQRRGALKIMGAIGTTCAFPFSANELYGQQEAPHQHESAQVPKAETAPYKPRVLTAEEYKYICVLADLIIPPTDTPGAVAAGVPQYIDEVLSRNNELLATFRSGVAWLSTSRFLTLSGNEQTALLMPISQAVDQGQARMPEQKFFRSMKNLTADGYYTSYAGLVTELGYQGGQALASFPSCEMLNK